MPVGAKRASDQLEQLGFVIDHENAHRASLGPFVCQRTFQVDAALVLAHRQLAPRVIIEKVLTGGFVPAKPGDGSYSAPVSILSVR